MNKEEPTGGSPRTWRPGRAVRLGGAGGLLIAFAAATIFLAYEECSTVTRIGVAGTKALETTCAPPSVSSATLLVVILGVVLLLWPDIAEVTVLGVTLKRQVEEAKKDAEEARGEAVETRSLLQQQNLRIDNLATAAASASAQMNLHFDGRSFYNKGEMGPELRQETNDVKSELGDTELLDSSLEGADVPELSLAVISAWERLSETLALGVYQTRVRPGVLSDLDWNTRKAQEEFVSRHGARIQTVRAIRNSIAHGKPIERADLLEGLELARGLQQLANETLGQVEESGEHRSSDDR